MKKILIGTAIAGMIVGTFASLSFAAPAPGPMVSGASSTTMSVAQK